MIKSVWVVMQTEFVNSLWGSNNTNLPVEVTDGITGKRNGWTQIPPNEVVNLIGDEAVLRQFTSDNAGNIVTIDGWIQGLGVDDLEDYPTDPARVLSLMPDFQDSSSPTFNNPNWHHVYLGQAPEKLIFAGQFTDEFSQEFL